MNRLPASVIMTLVFFSACKKDLSVKPSAYLEKVKAEVKAVLPEAQWREVDFYRARRTAADSTGTCLLRLPFTENQLARGFVLLQTTAGGEVTGGRIIHLEKERGTGVPYRYKGAITIRALDGTLLTQSVIQNGYILAFHQQTPALKTTSLLPPEYEELPDVVVVASYSDVDATYIYSDWIRLESVYANSTIGGSDYFYSLSDGGSGATYEDGETSGGSGSVDSMYDDGGIVLDSPILIDYETQDLLEPIDLQKYLNCFNDIPDDGATCSIEIFADIPVDGDSYKLFDFNNGSPGHTFLQLKKSNGSLSIMQNIGFYPKSGLKAVLTNAPIEGKFVDNSGHEYNASFKMNLNPENFRSTLTEILYLSNFIQYDLDNYNCTDFALDVFNKTRSNKIEIDLYDIPGNYPSTGTRTPQGLYNKLVQMKEASHPEASKITLDIYKGWVANSNGPCF